MHLRDGSVLSTQSLPWAIRVVIAIAAGVLPSLIQAQATITIDDGVSYQTMRGWEVTPFVSSDCDPLFEAVRDTVIALAVDDVGIDRVRLEIRSGVENDIDHYADFVAAGCPQPPDPDYQTWRENRYATVNDNADPNLIDPAGFHFTELDRTIEEVILPMRARVEANGESLFVNLCYVAFTSQIVAGGYIHDVPDEYAEFVLATYQHMDTAYGFVPHTWEVLLEPDNVAEWNGTLIGQAVVAAAARLSAAGYTPRFVAPSNTSMAGAVTYFDALAAVPGAVDHLVEYSYHRYTGVSESNLAAIVSRAHTYGLSTGMLEWWFGNATYEVLHQDLTLGENSTWQGRTLRSLFEVQGTTPGNLTVSYNRDTRYNRQYFKFVRQGALRVGASSDGAAFEPIAWTNPDGGMVVVVKAASGGPFEIDGLPAGTYGVKYTLGAANQDPSAYDVDLPDVVVGSGVLSTAIPDRGVLTVFSRPAASSLPEDPLGGLHPHDAGGSGGLAGSASWPSRAVPNPASGHVGLQYTVEATGRIQIRIYDATGRVVHERGSSIETPGEYLYTWRDQASEGVYLYEIRWNGQPVSRSKLVCVAP